MEYKTHKQLLEEIDILTNQTELLTSQNKILNSRIEELEHDRQILQSICESTTYEIEISRLKRLLNALY
jgi:prefoldin subunit 5